MLNSQWNLNDEVYFIISFIFTFDSAHYILFAMFYLFYNGCSLQLSHKIRLGAPLRLRAANWTGPKILNGYTLNRDICLIILTFFGTEYYFLLISDNNFN